MFQPSKVVQDFFHRMYILYTDVWWMKSGQFKIPSGKLLHNYGKSPLFMDNSLEMVDLSIVM